MANQDGRRHYKELPHGTISGYNNWGCRCESCRQAHRDYYGHRPATEVRAEQFREHGPAAYKKRGCRCDVCRARSAETKRRYRERNPDYNHRQNEARMRRYRAQREAVQATRSAEPS